MQLAVVDCLWDYLWSIFFVSRQNRTLDIVSSSLIVLFQKRWFWNLCTLNIIQSQNMPLGSWRNVAAWMMPFRSYNNSSVAVCHSFIYWVHWISLGISFEIFFSFLIYILSPHSHTIDSADFPKLFLSLGSLDIVSVNVISSIEVL